MLDYDETGTYRVIHIAASLRGRVSRFSLDALVNIATALGRRVSVELDAA